MNLFNKKYHIQVHMRKLPLEKKKKNVGCKRGSMETKIESGFQFRGGQSMNENFFFLMTWWFIKLKSMVDKKLHFIT